MSARVLVLHARARRIPAISAGLGVLALATWALAAALADASGQIDPADRMSVAALVSLVAAVLVSTTLAGADDELELSTRTRWARLRTGTLVAVTVLASTLLALAGTWAPGQLGAHALVRGVVGEVGLIVLCAAVVGARAAWVPVLGLAIVALARGPVDQGVVSAMLTWQVQPTDVRAAGATALALGIVGVVIHARRGSRASAP